MASVGESSSSQVEETQGAQPRHASEAEEEILRQGEQKRLEKPLKKDLQGI